MGIINLTNNSFWEKSRFNIENAIEKAIEMLQHGATIIDIGAQSTKPGADFVNAETELSQLLPFIQTLKKQQPNCWISVDTFQPEVANACLNEGADIINDVYAGNFDGKMYQVIAKWHVPYIIMHMQGNPKTMQLNPKYTNVTAEVTTFFNNQIMEAKKAGVTDIILDPGFGFGKSSEHNFELIKNFRFFNELSLPLLAGISRKSFIYNALNTTAEFALNGTTYFHGLLLEKGTTILRVHDVQPAIECIELYTKLNSKT